MEQHADCVSFLLNTDARLADKQFQASATLEITYPICSRFTNALLKIVLYIQLYIDKYTLKSTLLDLVHLRIVIIDVFL